MLVRPHCLNELGACADQDPEAKYEALDKYARDLTQAAREGKLDPVIGRDDEVRRCIQILSRRTKNNPVLIVAEALAQRIVAGDVPSALEGRSLLSLDLGALIAGAPPNITRDSHLRDIKGVCPGR
jgi:ATP-dependent Clp protease ATP-binding subunit ClpB